MLADPSISAEFLDKYKRLLSKIRGEEPQSVTEFTKARDSLYQDWLHDPSYRSEAIELVDPEFYSCVERAVFGDFIYLKKYKIGYVLQSLNSGEYYCTYALLSPIDEILQEFVLVKTALVPFKGIYICDGLIQDKGIYMGKSMIKECRDGYLAAKKAGKLIK